MDTTFFKGVDGFGVVDLRAESKHIYWDFCESERLSEYSKALSFVDTKYKVKSITIDGKRGLRQMIEKRYGYTVPVQYCHFHQVATITRYTTRTPKTDCGKDLRSLILKLKDSSLNDFGQAFEELKTKHKDFLKEKNEQGNFSHQNLRKAVRSIQTNLPYLFTFERYPNLNIPKTTNSCDGNFGQWKRKIKLHNSLSKTRKMKMVNEFLGYENDSI
jgi:transposase-like protein